LTIELRDAIPVELRDGIGAWLFGCDVCQEVCPWNSHAEPNRPAEGRAEFEPLAENNPIDLIKLLDLDEVAFRARFRRTPLWRPKRRGILRNAAIALGNRPTPAALPALVHALDDGEPLVRGAVAWALGNYREAAAGAALERRRGMEEDAEVRREIDRALARRC
jgi:epoxyqueuosine reductase